MITFDKMCHGLLCFSFILIWIFLSFCQAQTVTPPGVVNLLDRELTPGICPQGTYGERCEYECHCPKGTECDPETGHCPDGCAAGWAGAPYCQAENIALGKKTYQHGTYLGWNASRAVDGNPDQDGTYGSCAWAHNSEDVFKTWWNVDLGSIHEIQSMEVFFRTDDAMSQARRAGIRIYVSNSVEEAKNEGLCYMDQMSDFVFPPPHLILRDGSLTCTKRRGRYVIIYVDRPTQTPIRDCPQHTLYSCWANLELCEVLVFACSTGTYGEMCEKRCHCLDNTRCDAKTGTCSGYCQSGWEGVACDRKCSNGYYGINCNMTCGQCADPPRSCDRDTGMCVTCLPGWSGDRCDIACRPGTYGVDCSGTCGNCIGTCDSQTGVCALGCKPGWIGSKCDLQCKPGLYGPSCESVCANCLDGAVCDHVTGYCPDGCAMGFVGKRCDVACKNGLYGLECLQVCGNCKENVTCDHVTGNCPDGCENGWLGTTCQKPCNPGFYGGKCVGECGVCRNNEPCDVRNGVCPMGCGDGWNGEKCKNRCSPGHYGPGCQSNCGACKNGQACDHVTGVCKGGCSNGWKGEDCREACTKGFYGEDCKKKCGFCKNQTTCNHVDGLCAKGCDADYIGEYCIVPLTIPDPNIKGATNIGDENMEISVVVGGVMGGVLVVFIGIMLFVMLRRCKNSEERPSRKTKRRNRETHTSVEIVNDDRTTNNGSSAGQSPTPSRASSMATIKTNCTQSHVTIDDQEVLYVNLKKKNPTPLPIPVPSPKLSTFQRKNLANGTPNGSANGTIPRGKLDDDYDEDSHTYYNTQEDLISNRQGTPVHQFSDYIRDMENLKTGFKDEFTQYPRGLRYPHEAGKRPRNKFKNRFAQMFPYDHSRVVLEEDPNEPDSDYINGSYIESVDYPNCYIATQGPNKITLNDFWRMVWQNKCGKIVMLTNLIEESKNKCDKYWPEEREPLTFGDLKIHLNQVHEYPYYTIRLMTLSSARESADIRVIKQFHFTAWPDHGVPDTFEIISFFRCVIRTPMTLPGPMIVHCSAGVGRTGTFIALDALYHYAKRCKTIDVPSYVFKIRRERMNMIQTIEQYRLLHFALQEALEYSDTTLSKRSFQTECHRSIQSYNAGQPNRIAQEFQKLEDKKPKFGNECFLAGLRKENVEKNRSLNVLAADKYRPYLSTYVPDSTDYINAVVIPSRNNKLGYIVTQLPLNNTVIDFWRLIYDHRSTIIVTLNAPDEDQDETCAWWPSIGDTVTMGPLVVETLAVEMPCKEVTERTFRIMRKGVKDSKLVYMITFNEWFPGKYLPVSIESFLVLQGRVNLYRRSFPDAPITVLCLDGVMCSGIFVAANNVLDQVVQDNEVDIFNTVRQLQQRRPQFIKNKDQYLFIYQAVNKYIESTAAVYGNVETR